MSRSREKARAKTERNRARLRENQWRFDAVGQVVGAATVPLLTPCSDGNVEPIASGVLTKTYGDVFLFTAAHALKDLEGRPVLIPGRDGKFLLVAGRAVGDKLDAGVVKIEREDMAPLLDIALPGGMVFMQGDVLTDHLSLYGYAARAFKIGEFGPEHPAYHYRLEGKQAHKYQRLGYSPQDHILLSWHKEILGHQVRERRPNMAGMSGSGVWFSPLITGRTIADHVQDPLPRLVGIFIEAKPRDSMLVATNVSHHVKLVCAAYPEIGERFRRISETRLANMLKGKPLDSIIRPWRRY